MNNAGQAKSAKAGAAEIHPTAIVHPSAQLGAGVTVGPYSVIGEGVSIGEGTEVMNHVSINGPTVIGARNRIFPYASLGQDPQDKKFEAGEDSRLEVGDDNIIRESVTLNRGTASGGGLTRIGHRNWIMAYCHVAHDCKVGNDAIFANNATLGGHVKVGDKAYLGGFTAVHQFCSIGEMTMTGGHTMIAQDVTPYVIAVGNRVKVHGLNKVGLQRNGVPKEDLRKLNEAYRLFFRRGMKADEALEKITAELTGSSYVDNFVAFIRNSTRGICR